MRINSKRELCEYLIEKLNWVTSQETIDLIEEIGDLYLHKEWNTDPTEKERETIFENSMHEVYSEFCKNVLETYEPEYEVKQKIALQKIIIFLMGVIKTSNKKRGIIEPTPIIENRILDAWRMILSREIWFTFPDSIKNWTQLVHIKMKIDTILNMIRAKMKDKDSRFAKDLKMKKDEIALRDMLMMGGL